MNKLLKLTGVSMLAIVAASNANAAGYTCEELIEYTSCNTGYALLDGDCVCDGGYYTNGDKCTICPIGTYSSVNASECTTCPTTGLVDPDNNAIVATTASTGSKNISACIIPTNVTIKGTTGLYHFKSSCAYSGLTPGTQGGNGDGVVKVPTLDEACAAAGYEACNTEGDGGYWCDSGWMETVVYEPTTGKTACYESEGTSMSDGDSVKAVATLKSACAESGGTWDIDKITCNCPSNTTWTIGDAEGYRYWKCWTEAELTN